MENIIDLTNNQLKFNNKNVLTIIDNENNPWFKAKDIAEILEYKNTRQAIILHVDEEDKHMYFNINLGSLSNRRLKSNEENTLFINESGLFSLILRSRKKEAKMFKKWVTSEVLPSIRKYGEYKLKEENKMLKIILESNQKIIEIKNKTIEKIIPHVVCKDFSDKMKHEFVLIKKNLESKYPYYIIRTQKRNVNQAIEKLRLKYPLLEILLSIYSPNSFYLYNQMKTSLRLEHDNNHFTTNLEEKELIHQILKIDSEKI